MKANIESITAFNRLFGFETMHPMVTIVDFSKIPSFGDIESFYSSFYTILLKDRFCGKLRYGKNHYDYDEDTMVFIGPNQTIGVDQLDDTPSGVGILFHPDLLVGSSLLSKMNRYRYFSYDIGEALHLSPAELRIIKECFSRLTYEVERPIDKHSRKIIISTIKLLLDYCDRFYDRQFVTREALNSQVVIRFRQHLDQLFDVEMEHLPTVKELAAELNLSPNYMSDLIRKETGMSALEHIQLKIVEKAKVALLSTELSISEIAYQLGFEYPQYFTRHFKKYTGVTPTSYRSHLN